MDGYIKLTDTRRRDLCALAGEELGIAPESIEKDFWVCWTLRELITLPEFGNRLTFKGGTSLSKGWKLIERFSEDIDVVIDRDALGFGGNAAPDAPGITSKERERRLEALATSSRMYVTGPLSHAFELRVRERLSARDALVTPDPDDSDGQTLLFQYPQSFPANGYLRPVVKVEFGARSDVEPTATPEIRPYLEGVAGSILGTSAFNVRTVAPERTFWEMAMLLHEERHRTGTPAPKPRISRHYYDLFRLIRNGIGARAAADLALFERIAVHRAIYFRKNAAARNSLKQGTLALLPSPQTESAWRDDFNRMRDAVFFGEPPTFDEILREVGDFETSFNAKPNTTP